MLLIVNGAPGVGKSALAADYAERHPLTLIVEVDDLRRHLGGWAASDASKQVARDLAVALARSHLAAGHDVVIPQFLSRPEFVSRLQLVADEAKVRCIEVVLTDDDDAIIERFKKRRERFLESGVRHPEGELSNDGVAAELRSANQSLRQQADDRTLAVIDSEAGIEPAYATLCSVIDKAD